MQLWLAILGLVVAWNAVLWLRTPRYDPLDDLGDIGTAYGWPARLTAWERYTRDQLCEVTAAERARARERERLAATLPFKRRA